MRGSIAVTRTNKVKTTFARCRILVPKLLITVENTNAHIESMKTHIPSLAFSTKFKALPSDKW